MKPFHSVEVERAFSPTEQSGKEQKQVNPMNINIYLCYFERLISTSFSKRFEVADNIF